MRISVKELSKSTPHLAGATNGEQDRGRIAARLGADDETVLFDFAGIETATSSYLKALLFGFFEEPQRSGSSVKLKPAFPVLVRLSDIVREEIAQLASLAG